MAIKMRVSKSEKCICTSCNNGAKVSLEMYDVMIGEEFIALCDKCLEEMLRKCCSASCKYQAKLKSQSEIGKISAVKRLRDTREYTKLGESEYDA